MGRPGGLQPFVLHVHPVGRRDTDFRPWPVAALVLVVDSGTETRIDPRLTAASLGLTPTEGRVAALLAEGKTVDGIAAATERKGSTIRWHVQRIFRKLGVTRQPDLVRVVLSAAGPPRARRRK